MTFEPSNRQLQSINSVVLLCPATTLANTTSLCYLRQQRLKLPLHPTAPRRCPSSHRRSMLISVRHIFLCIG
ncbi:hypothetical protein BDR03DRAFT_596470 [Suillus americanus]|nr:hypothetical protein BDR03DRAFT_596470 [Suillus americanus]